MEAPVAAPKPVRINRFLPYWAVFQSDIRQTLRSWIYQAWMFLTIAAAAGYLLYSLGAKQEASWIMPAHNMISEVLRWVLLGSMTLIIVLAAGSICSERGNLADSILCRGISRYQYFAGKWHARLVVILGTFFAMSSVTTVAAAFLLHGENLSLIGCMVAVALVAAVLMLVISCGVAASALANNTLVSIAIVWLAVYGGCFVLSFLPEQYPSPDRLLKSLPNILRGQYDPRMVWRLIGSSVGLSFISSLVGMIGFSRRDV